MIVDSKEQYRRSLFARYDQLTENLISKKDNEKLHEGFEKKCGLKGAKLSGGQK
jgi:ATP-binding cassette subfamily B (MDR/TAP) protein 1